MILGLTGGSGCGTSLAGSLLERAGWEFIDCDRVYHQLLAKDVHLADVLASAFGQEVYTPEGFIDRKVLAKIVFSGADMLEKLNGITHPAVLEAVTRQIETSEKENICIEAVELIESGISSLCNGVIGVLADYETRIYRIMIRDALLKSDAVRRIDAQRPDSYYIAGCDCCIYNNGTVEEFQQQLISAVESIKKQNRS